MAFILRRVVVGYLQSHPGEQFTAREIALWTMATYPTEAAAKKARAHQNLESDADLEQQWAAEIGAAWPLLRDQHHGLKITEGRPRKYYYSEKSEIDEVKEAEGGLVVTPGAPGESKLSEAQLYPLLAAYLREDLGMRSKRIDEKTSSNGRGPAGNRWLHPDVVALEDLGKAWSTEVKDCAKQLGDTRTRLWSFEVKLLINRSNVRETYFQAVSNSSWANFGYLVAAQIAGSGGHDDTMKELRMLAAAHGIGVILLHGDAPSESEMLIPARERTGIDWDTANRLAEENADFRLYLQLVTKYNQAGGAELLGWDVVPAG